MPNIIGTSLKTSEPVELVDLLKGRISLVAISGTRFGEEHINTFMTPFLSKWSANAKDSKVQLVELNIQENPLKAGLVRMMVPFVKKTIPEERHVSFVCKQLRREEEEGKKYRITTAIFISNLLCIWFQIGKLCTALQVNQTPQGSIEYAKLLPGLCFLGR